MDKKNNWHQKLTPALRYKLALLVVEQHERNEKHIKGYRNKHLLNIFRNTLLDLVEPSGEIKLEYRYWLPECRKFYFTFYLEPLLTWFYFECGYAAEIVAYLEKITESNDSILRLTDEERDGAEALFNWNYL